MVRPEHPGLNAKSLPEANMTGPSPSGSAPSAAAPDAAALHATRMRLARVATVLDSGIALPGTGWTIGVESLVGLIPGIGDVAGALFGGYFIVEALRLRAPRAVLLRMLGNVLFDMALGVVPVAGDLADFAFKSNQRNLRLLHAHLDERLGVAPAPAPRRRWRALLALTALLLIAWAIWRFGGFTR